MNNSFRLDLSVIIVSWNTCGLLRDCLESVRQAIRTSELSIEVIVIDNGSKDGSPEFVKAEYPGVLLMELDRNLGFAGANNLAMSESRGRQVLLLNSDTMVHGDVLDASVGLLDCEPNVGAMGCTVLNPDGSIQRSASDFPGLRSLLLMTMGANRERPMTWDTPRPSGHDVDVISGCFLMVRRRVIEQVGLLDESFFFFGEETDWCHRIRGAGWRTVQAPVGRITHLGGGSAKKLRSHRDLLLTGAFIRLQRKHHGLLAAWIMWGLLLVFNGSRCAYWTLASVLARSDSPRSRRAHFQKILGGYHRVWRISSADGAAANEVGLGSAEVA